MHALPPGLQPQRPPEHDPPQQSLSTEQTPPCPAQHRVPAQTVLQHSTPAPQVAFVVLHEQLPFEQSLLQQSPEALQECW